MKNSAVFAFCLSAGLVYGVHCSYANVQLYNDQLTFNNYLLTSDSQSLYEIQNHNNIYGVMSKFIIYKDMLNLIPEDREKFEKELLYYGDEYLDMWIIYRLAKYNEYDVNNENLITRRNNIDASNPMLPILLGSIEKDSISSDLVAICPYLNLINHESIDQDNFQNAINQLTNSKQTNRIEKQG